MTRPLQSVKPAISYTVAEAALASGIGETSLRAANASQELDFHYIGLKAVVLADDLIEYVRSLPVERAS